MRKLLLSFILIFSLCACSPASTVKPETKNLTFTAVGVFDETEYILSAGTDENSNLSISVQNPENLANLKLSFTPNNVMLNYLNLEKTLSLDSLSEFSFFRILYEGILNASETQCLELKDDEYFFTYLVSDEKFTFYFGQSGLPLKIEGKNIEIIIKGISISN